VNKIITIVKGNTLVGIALVLFAAVSVPTRQTATETAFPIGPGVADVIPHQLVRTADDRLYVFAARAQYTSSVVGYWTEESGLPAPGSFTGTTEIDAGDDVISVDTVYDGEFIIHVLCNTRAGNLIHYPFDIRENRFGPEQTLATGMPTVEGDYIGTSGVSGMMDRSGRLHIAYWSEGDHITHQAYTYDSASESLIAVGEATQVDSSGHANHPVVAVSPADDSLTVAWVSEATDPARILVRTRGADGEWGDEETISSAPVWTSPNAGINIDQGPSLVIGSDGIRHLAYIENWDNTNNYGRVHYVSDASGRWIDEALSTYSHDPALAITDADALYIIGHGPTSDGTNVNMYAMRRNDDGSWDDLELIASPQGNDTFDSSPSVKWSAVGFQRPEVVEFIFFSANNGQYSDTTIYYGRLPVAEAAGAFPMPVVL